MLSKSKRSPQEGVRYYCDKCDYSTTRQHSLKIHKGSKHEGLDEVRYYCDKCNYSTTRQHSLKIHKRLQNINLFKQQTQ